MNIILAPVITEKSESLKSNNVYVFKVSPKANKTQIKNEVETYLIIYFIITFAFFYNKRLIKILHIF